MRGCCSVSSEIPARQRRALRVVLAINAAMFLIEFGAGLLAQSTALLADSVDMLGDAIVYGFSLYVIGRGAVWQRRGALVKSGIMAVFGVGVLVEASFKIAHSVVPAAAVMSTGGVLALAGNASVLVFLWRHRLDDINMRSAWLCSRNDVVANVAIILAAGGVALTRSAWPDVVVGLAIAGLFGASAVEVIRRVQREAGRVDAHGFEPSLLQVPPVRRLGRPRDAP